MLLLPRRQRTPIHMVTAMLVACFLGACASGVPQTPAPLSVESTAGAQPAYRLADAVSFKLPTAYTRTIKAGSRWAMAGQVPQGRVYRSSGDVFWIEGAHAHEAYLVVDGGELVGFYLPVERSFSSLGYRVPVNFQKL
ncbi:hypothetical protein [Polaromonas sp. YR568]|uniref:hypothetical protein n=1 Tax=Polaromonas sp. YR568 TaxID=1855301 RepID=UPI00398BC9CE